MDTSATSPYPKDEIYLVTGGAGFIGSHIARRLHSLGAYVRIVDIAPATAALEVQCCSQYFCGNLCDTTFCALAMENVHTVIHFAAVMGGMGTIHDKNDFIIHRENSAMTTNVIEVALKAGVRQFLYASSACVYPAHLQLSSQGTVRLREMDAWANPPPTPQGLYGLEKLAGEMLLHQFIGKLDVKIARFHNIYGPGGTWYGGREKVPAAFARKAIAAKLGSNGSPRFEIWGDGSQRRSFLYIDDAVEAVLRLLKTHGPQTVNVGSDRDVTMTELARLALVSGEVDPEDVSFDYDPSKPVGVMSRNSDNELVSQQLSGWGPTVSLEDGMKKTTAWIETQIGEQTAHLNGTRRSDFLAGLQRSTVVHLEQCAIVFAIILPITSHGADSPDACLQNLQVFAKSLTRTTRQDTRALGGTQFRLKVYLAVDHDDFFLLEGNKPERTLRTAGIVEVVRIVCAYPRGHVCSLWRECAVRAWQDGCDYMTLFGDDVELIDEGWLSDVHTAFVELAEKNKGPMGLGCVAFTDITFPGMPTFPVIHRIHMDIFGEVVPNCFINQDGDPYLFQLYRRFGSSAMSSSRIRNNVGGSVAARYHKEHAKDWTFQPLQDATETVAEWLSEHDCSVEKKLTLDVIIPSYRVQMKFLKPILELKSTESCSIMWIIIIDDPNSPTIQDLKNQYGDRPDVRIRVNPQNLGASATRNRGMAESAAEWVHFLDDDITPQANLLVEAEAIIRSNPQAAGFVGNALFPPADTIFKTAVHLAGVTYFWDIATKIQEDVPWGVTANLLVRRDCNDGVSFDHRFPKTGGGEDIDLCIRKRDWFVARNKQGFKAAPDVIVTHPWWNDGSRSYWRFYMWGKGDGALVSMFPQHCYLDLSPNSAELVVYSTALGLLGIVGSFWRLAVWGFLGIMCVVLSNILHDLYHHFVVEKSKDPRSTVSGFSWIMAVMEGSLIRIVSEGGRLVGQIERGEFVLFAAQRRFDWFVGRVGPGPIQNEKANSRQRLTILGFTMAVALLLREHPTMLVDDAEISHDTDSKQILVRLNSEQ